MLEHIAGLRNLLDRVNTHVEALADSLRPGDTAVKRQVILHLSEVSREIQGALDHLDSAESSANGTIDAEAGSPAF